MHSGCANILNTKVLKEIVVTLFPPPPLKNYLNMILEQKLIIWYIIVFLGKTINISIYFLSFSNDY